MKSWRHIFSWEEVSDNPLGHLVHLGFYWGVVVAQVNDSLWSWWADDRRTALLRYEQLKRDPTTRKSKSDGGELAYLSYDEGDSSQVLQEFIEIPPFGHVEGLY
jgi:hypothetical protein